MHLPSKWIACDPGETTGYSVWSGATLVCAGQADLWEFVRCVAAPLAAAGVWRHQDPELLRRVKDWELLVMEEWQLYPWKAQDLAWDRQDTVRGIGALQLAAEALGRPYSLQPAAIKEAAEAAGAADLFSFPLYPNRHANDALRHGTYYLASKGIGVASA